MASFYDTPTKPDGPFVYADVWVGDESLCFEVKKDGVVRRCADLKEFQTEIDSARGAVCTVGAHRWVHKPKGLRNFHDVLWQIERTLRFMPSRRAFGREPYRGAEWVEAVWNDIHDRNFFEWTASSGRQSRFAAPTFHVPCCEVELRQSPGYLRSPAAPTEELLDHTL